MQFPPGKEAYNNPLNLTEKPAKVKQTTRFSRFFSHNQKKTHQQPESPPNSPTFPGKSPHITVGAGFKPALRPHTIALSTGRMGCAHAVNCLTQPNPSLFPVCIGR